MQFRVFKCENLARTHRVDGNNLI